jgi:omega-6 fatty acid desaturase (delta-12 desaturase)
MPVTPTDIPAAYRKEAEREIRAFTRDWTARDDRLAVISYGGTFAFYFMTLWLTISLWPNPWLVVPLIVINALSGVRLYVLQHDCGHGSLFTTRARNDLAGLGLSVFTLSPYRVMQSNHGSHHNHLGNLDERHTTEIYTMTLTEWEAADGWQRLWYRLYRNPAILIPIGGLFTYVFAYRWPHNTWQTGPVAVLAHNLGLAAWIMLIWALAGVPGLIIYGGTVMVAACVGVFMVYLQHNFEDTWWDRKPGLNPARAALQGSSALDLGRLWDLATGNIAYHDIHHFNANIPSYRLRQCHKALRARYDVQTIGWPEAIRSFTLKLWDEDQGRLVPFPRHDAQAQVARDV